jgi:ketosteroid isomerase-like protein
MEPDRKALAERYFRAVYTGDLAVIDDLASDAIVITYPIFSSLFGTPLVRGRTAVKEFGIRFSSRWADPQISIHEALAEGDCVVLLWDFRARNLVPIQPGDAASRQEHRWGGITLFRFDETGKIIAEIGEESDPGPVARLSSSGAI